MRILTWTLRLVVFLVLVAFAAKNLEPATLHFYFDLTWQAPLVVLLLVFLGIGALLGLLAMLGTLLRQRREIQRLRREARKRQAAQRREEERPQPTLPPAVDA